MTKFRLSKEFRKSYKELPAETKELTKQKLILLAGHPFPPYHPSLRVKKLQKSNSIMELSVNMEIRITGEYSGDDCILLRNIGDHKILP